MRSASRAELWIVLVMRCTVLEDQLLSGGAGSQRVTAMPVTAAPATQRTGEPVKRLRQWRRRAMDSRLKAVAPNSGEMRVEALLSDTKHDLVADGYDAVYAALPGSPTLRRIWREQVLGAEYPEEFAHISLLTLPELRRVAAALRLSPNAIFVDLACGAGGPGLWVARESGAQLRGIDVSAVGIAYAADYGGIAHAGAPALPAPGAGGGNQKLSEQGRPLRYFP